MTLLWIVLIGAIVGISLYSANQQKKPGMQVRGSFSTALPASMEAVSIVAIMRRGPTLAATAAISGMASMVGMLIVAAVTTKSKSLTF